MLSLKYSVFVKCGNYKEEVTIFHLKLGDLCLVLSRVPTSTLQCGCFFTQTESFARVRKKLACMFVYLYTYMHIYFLIIEMLFFENKTLQLSALETLCILYTVVLIKAD